MNLQQKIQSIRNKPEHIRIRYALIGAILGTFFVALIWIITAKANNIKNINVEDTFEVTTGSVSGENDIKNKLEETKKSFNETKDALNNLNSAANSSDTASNQDNRTRESFEIDLNQ